MTPKQHCGPENPWWEGNFNLFEENKIFIESLKPARYFFAPFFQI